MYIERRDALGLKRGHTVIICSLIIIVICIFFLCGDGADHLQ